MQTTTSSVCILLASAVTSLMNTNYTIECTAVDNFITQRTLLTHI